MPKLHPYIKNFLLQKSATAPLPAGVRLQMIYSCACQNQQAQSKNHSYSLHYYGGETPPKTRPLLLHTLFSWRLLFLEHDFRIVFTFAKLLLQWPNCHHDLHCFILSGHICSLSSVLLSFHWLIFNCQPIV